MCHIGKRSFISTLLSVVIGGVLSAGVLPCLSQPTNKAPLPLVTNILDVLRMPRKIADMEYPVTLKATVTLFDNKARLFFVQDQTAGIYLWSSATDSYSPGQAVNISGVSKSGKFSPIISASKITLIGTNPIPRTKPVAIQSILTGREDAQWVEFEGVVYSQRTDWSGLLLNVGSDGNTVEVRVLETVADKPELAGAVVRVHGIAGCIYDTSDRIVGFGAFAPTLASISILAPALKDPFAAPSGTSVGLKEFKPSLLHDQRVLLKGVVTHIRTNRWIMFQDETGPLRIPYEDNVTVGETIEASGFAVPRTTPPSLHNVILRKAGPGRTILPRITSVDKIRGGENDGELIRVEGTVITSYELPEGNRTIISLHHSNLTFVAYLLHPPNHEGIQKFIPGTKLSLTGVCTPRRDDSNRDQLNLWLRDASDIQVISTPPMWENQTVFWSLFGTTLVVAGIFTWGWTLRKRMLQKTTALREREARLEEQYHDLFENAYDIIFSHDFFGNITSLNKAGLDILGYSPEEAKRLNLSQLVSPADWAVLQSSIDRQLRGLGRTFYELELRDREGAPVTLEINSRVDYKDGTAVGIRAIARDISDRKKTLEKLRKSDQQSRHALEVRERIARDLHDGIIQSVYAVGLSIENARSMVAEEPIKATERLGKSLGNLNEIIRSLRSFLVGLDPEASKPSNFKPALEKLAASMNVSPTNQIHLEVNPEAAAKLTLHERSHLLQIAREAVSNSLRHSHASSTMVRLTENDDCLTFEVSDDGVGFNPDTVRESGFGLRNMVFRAEELGTRMQVISNHNEGTRIILSLAPRTAGKFKDEQQDPCTTGG